MDDTTQNNLGGPPFERTPALRVARGESIETVVAQSDISRESLTRAVARLDPILERGNSIPRPRKPQHPEELYPRMPIGELQRRFHISLKHRYLYVAVPKAATSTIKSSLQQIDLEGSGIDRSRDFLDRELVHRRMASPLVAPFQLDRAMFAEVLFGKEYFRFAAVRNPYSRLLSCYLDRIQSDSGPRKRIAKALGQPVGDEITFDRFVEAVESMDPAAMNQHWRPQAILTAIDTISYDAIIRFENLSRELPVILNAVAQGGGDLTDDKRNVSPAKTNADSLVDSYYTPEARSIVRRVYAEDFDAFGYAMR